MPNSSLPSRSDPRWRRARLATSGVEVSYLPLAPPHIPRLTKDVAWLREGARLILLDDGYPAKLTKAGVVVHPLHGRYVLEDLLRQFEVRPTDTLRQAIVRTAAATVGRSEVRGSSRLLWYEGGAPGSLLGGRTYISGLAQAYYASLLTRVASITGDAGFAKTADQFFEPLLTPVAEGGVLYEGRPGPSLAMVPMRPRDWILNGWLSMLVSVGRFAAERPAPSARELLETNVRTLVRVLPAFDAPEQRLSRYMLPGIQMLRLSFSTAVDGVIVRDLRVTIPDEPEDVAIPLREATGWQPRVLPHDADPGDTEGDLRPRSQGLRMVALLSRAPFPRRNRLQFHVVTPRPMELALSAYVGAYDPLKSATVDRAWADLASTLLTAGSHAVSMSLPYEAIDLFSYPTNFARSFGGRQLNTYHGTHIVRLRQLAEMTGNRTLASWARRWRGYVDEWPTIPSYRAFGCWTPEGSV